MKVINLGANNSIINQFVAELRDVNIQKDRMRFRNNIRRIGNLMAYEISKTLKYKETDVVTPLATAKMNLPIDNIVIGTVFRAGLPFHQGFLDIFDQADPMLATGESLILAHKAFVTKGVPKKIILASVIATEEGVARLNEKFPNTNIVLYTAAIDPILNDHKYIVPGLGDAGDLMYGEKL